VSSYAPYFQKPYHDQASLPAPLLATPCHIPTNHNLYPSLQYPLQRIRYKNCHSLIASCCCCRSICCCNGQQMDIKCNNSNKQRIPTPSVSRFRYSPIQTNSNSQTQQTTFSMMLHIEKISQPKREHMTQQRWTKHQIVISSPGYTTNP
jgi:hypothetical protein